MSKVGYPYSQAYRDSGDYYDCSSLAYYAWRSAGVSIMYEGSNTAASEGKLCYDNNLLVNYDEMQPGDIHRLSRSANEHYGRTPLHWSVYYPKPCICRLGAAQALEYYISDPNFFYLLANKDVLTEKEAKQISLHNVLGYASGLARAIKDGDLITMRRHAGRPEGYLESFAQCATRMMNIINDRKKEPGQVQGDGQLSLFQFGMETGQCR